MKHYFIHACKSNENFEVHEYLNGQLLSSSEIELDQFQNAIATNSIVNFLLPSNQCITLKGSNNESETDEQFKARFLMENEYELIDDISNYLFVHSREMELVTLIDKKLIEPINDSLNELGCDIRIFPEHCLLFAYSKDACMDFNGRFIFSFKDGSGFSINEIDSEGYLNLLKRENPDYNPRCMSENKMLRDAFPKSRNEEKSALADLHGHFMSEQQLSFPNIFQKRLSFRSIYRRFDFSSNQLGLSLLLILSLVALPVINLSIMHSYEGEYREKIKRTFSSINPNSRRVINPRAQMDELLSNQITSQPNNIDLSAFTYLSALNMEDISRTSIDFEKATIELEFNGIGQMKYTLIERLIEEFGLSILTNDLVTVDSKVSGILKLEYPNE